MNKTAVIYTRVSSKEQVAGTSLDTQMAECTRFAERSGYSVVATFTDAGLSAKTADNRPDLQKALQFCLRKKVKALIVWKVDRLSRNTGDGIAIREMLKRGGCEVVSATEGFTADPLGDAMSSILLTFAQLDNAQRAIRCRTGMEETALRGGWCHKAPVGFDCAKSPEGLPILVPNVTGKALQIILKDYAHKRITKATYYARCEAIGIPTTVAERIPNRDIFAGIIKEDLTGGQPVQAAFEGLVTWEELLAIRGQKCKLNRRGKLSGDAFETAVKGLLKCQCGRALTPYTTKKKRYWKCSKCGKPNMPAHALYALIRDELERTDYLADLLRAAVTYAKSTAKKEIADRRKIYAAQAKEGEKAKKHLDKLTDLFLDEKIDAETFEKKAAELRATIERSNRNKTEVELDINRHLSHIEKVAEKLENTRVFIESLSPERARAALEYIFGSFELQPNRTILTRSNSDKPSLHSLLSQQNPIKSTKNGEPSPAASSSNSSSALWWTINRLKLNDLGVICGRILEVVG